MKNKILKTITAIAAVLSLLAGSALDDYGYTANFICLGCSIWIGLFLIANRKRVMNLW